MNDCAGGRGSTGPDAARRYGDALKKHFQRAKASQAAFARAIPIDPSAITRFFQGERIAPKDFLTALGAFLTARNVPLTQEELDHLDELRMTALQTSPKLKHQVQYWKERHDAQEHEARALRQQVQNLGEGPAQAVPENVAGAATPVAPASVHTDDASETGGEAVSEASSRQGDTPVTTGEDFEGLARHGSVDDVLKTLSVLHRRGRWDSNDLVRSLGQYRPVDELPHLLARLRVGEHFEDSWRVAWAVGEHRPVDEFPAAMAALPEENSCVTLGAADRPVEDLPALVQALRRAGMSSEAEDLLRTIGGYRDPKDAGATVAALRTTGQDPDLYLYLDGMASSSDEADVAERIAGLRRDGHQVEADYVVSVVPAEQRQNVLRKVRPVPDNARRKKQPRPGTTWRRLARGMVQLARGAVLLVAYAVPVLTVAVMAAALRDGAPGMGHGIILLYVVLGSLTWGVLKWPFGWIVDLVTCFSPPVSQSTDNYLHLLALAAGLFFPGSLGPVSALGNGLAHFLLNLV